MTKELNEIQADLKKLDQLSELKESVNFMANQFDELIKGVAENKKKLCAVEKENKMLKSEVEQLKASVKFLNGQRVKNDCIISGVIVPNNQTAIETVLKLSTDAGVDLQPNNIEEAYFMKRRNEIANKEESKKTVVVKLNSKNSKEKMMSIKPKLKEKGSTVYVSDFLSRESLSLLNYAKTLKNVGYQAVYAFDGNIFCKRSEPSKSRLIRNEGEVDDLLLAASTNKPKGRKNRPS